MNRHGRATLDRHKQRTQEDMRMTHTSESETSGSWIERGRASGAVASTWGSETGSAPNGMQGWDPYDVWLRRVELPRRQRAHGGAASPMVVSNPL
jgi:hypothetical protein